MIGGLNPPIISMWLFIINNHMRIRQLHENPHHLELDQIKKTVQDLQNRYKQLFDESLLVFEDQVDWNLIIIELERKLLASEKTDYSTIDRMMRTLCSQFDCDVHQLHDEFVNKHHQTPDDWIKTQIPEV